MCNLAYGDFWTVDVHCVCVFYIGMGVKRSGIYVNKEKGANKPT